MLFGDNFSSCSNLSKSSQWVSLPHTAYCSLEKGKCYILHNLYS